jgi:hypothetical protein
MYGKKNKKKNKNVRKKNVFLSLWSRSVGIYDFRVDTFWKKKVSGDIIFCHLSEYMRQKCTIFQFAAARTFSFFYFFYFFLHTYIDFEVIRGYA